MESSENNNSSTSKETVTLNDEDANMQPTTSSSSSTSPKRYKLDPNAPSTSRYFPNMLQNLYKPLYYKLLYIMSLVKVNVMQIIAVAQMNTT